MISVTVPINTIAIKVLIKCTATVHTKYYYINYIKLYIISESRGRALNSRTTTQLVPKGRWVKLVPSQSVSQGARGGLCGCGGPNFQNFSVKVIFVFWLA